MYLNVGCCCTMCWLIRRSMVLFLPNVVSVTPNCCGLRWQRWLISRNKLAILLSSYPSMTNVQKFLLSSQHDTSNHHSMIFHMFFRNIPYPRKCMDNLEMLVSNHHSDGTCMFLAYPIEMFHPHFRTNSTNIPNRSYSEFGKLYLAISIWTRNYLNSWNACDEYSVFWWQNISQKM